MSPAWLAHSAGPKNLAAQTLQAVTIVFLVCSCAAQYTKLEDTRTYVQSDDAELLTVTPDVLIPQTQKHLLEPAEIEPPPEAQIGVEGEPIHNDDVQVIDATEPEIQYTYASPGSHKCNSAHIAIDHECEGYDTTHTMIQRSLGVCPKDNDCNPTIWFERRVNRNIDCDAIKDEVGGQCEFASSDERLEQDGFESPETRDPACVRSDKLHCIPSPCSLLTMSYFRDPMAESTPKPADTDSAHTCCIGAQKTDIPECEAVTCTDRVFVGTEYEEHRSIVQTPLKNKIVGHSTCDAQFGTEIFSYKGNTDRFKVVSKTTKPAMQSMARAAREKCGSDECFENWPNKLVLPSVLQHHRHNFSLPPNPEYMYRQDTPEEKAQLAKFFAGTTLLPPDPAPYQCSGSTPPPTIWIVPCCPVPNFNKYVLKEAGISNDGVYHVSTNFKSKYADDQNICNSHLQEKMYELHSINLDRHTCGNPASNKPFEMVVIGETINGEKWTLERLQRRYMAASYMRSYRILEKLSDDPLFTPHPDYKPTLHKKTVDAKIEAYASKINHWMGYTFEFISEQQHSAPHPMHVTCMSSSAINRFDTTKQTGVDGKHSITLANCEHDDKNNARMGFGALSSTYQSDSLVVTTLPQMAHIETKGKFFKTRSVPGSFSRFGQMLGIVPTPSLLTYLIKDTADVADNPEASGDCDNKESTHKHIKFCIEQKLFDHFQAHYFKESNINVDASYDRIADIAKRLRTRNSDSADPDYAGYSRTSCHLFSSFATHGGGCNWLPPHELPGICPDQRAKRQKDIVLPAHQSFLTKTGHQFGFLDFSAYKCSNYRMTPNYAHFDDHSVAETHFPTLQHPGPLDCLRARTNAKMDNIKYHPHVVMPNWKASKDTTGMRDGIGDAMTHNNQNYETTCSEGTDSTDAVYTCAKDDINGAGGYTDMHAETQGYKKAQNEQKTFGNHIFKFSSGYRACLHKTPNDKIHSCLDNPLHFMQTNLDNNVGVPLALDTQYDNFESMPEHIDGTQFFSTGTVEEKMPVPATYEEKTWAESWGDTCNAANNDDQKSNCFPESLREYEDTFCKSKEFVLADGVACDLKNFIAIWNVYQATQKFRMAWSEYGPGIVGVVDSSKTIFGERGLAYEKRWSASTGWSPFDSHYHHCYRHSNGNGYLTKNKDLQKFQNKHKPTGRHFTFFSGTDDGIGGTYDWNLAQLPIIKKIFSGEVVDDNDHLIENYDIKNSALFQNLVNDGYRGSGVQAFADCDHLFVWLCERVTNEPEMAQIKAACEQYDFFKKYLYDDHSAFMENNDAKSRLELHLENEGQGRKMGQSKQDMLQQIKSYNYDTIVRTPDNPNNIASSFNFYNCRSLGVPDLFKKIDRKTFCVHSGLEQTKFDSRQIQELRTLSALSRSNMAENVELGHVAARWFFQEQDAAKRGTADGYLLQTPLTAFGRNVLTHARRHAPYMFCPLSSCTDSSYSPRYLTHRDPRPWDGTVYSYWAYPFGNIDMSSFSPHKTMLESACHCCSRGDEYLLSTHPSDESVYQCYAGAVADPDRYTFNFAEPGGPLVDRCFCQSNVNVFHESTGTSNDDLAVAADYYRTRDLGRVLEMRQFTATGQRDIAAEQAAKDLDNSKFVQTAAHLASDAIKAVGLGSVRTNTNADGDDISIANLQYVSKLSVIQGKEYLLEPDAKPGYVFTDFAYDDVGPFSAEIELERHKKGVTFNSDYTLAIQTGRIFWHYNYSALSVRQLFPIHANTLLARCLDEELMLVHCTEFYAASKLRSQPETSFMHSHRKCVPGETPHAGRSLCFKLGAPATLDTETDKPGNTLPAAFFFGGEAALTFRYNPRQQFVDMYYRNSYMSMLRGETIVTDRITNLDITDTFHAWQTCESMVVKNKQACIENSIFTSAEEDEWTINLNKLDTDFITTTALHNAHVTKKFQLVVPFEGNSFARNQPFTSSITAGTACDCHNRMPVYACKLLTIDMADKSFPRVTQTLLASFQTDITQAERDVLDVVICGYQWNDMSTTTGLRMGGNIEPFYVTQRNLFKDDLTTTAFLDKMFDKQSEEQVSEQSKSPDIFDALRFKGRHDSNNFNEDVPWKFESSCLRWPFGQAHIASFDDSSQTTLTAGTPIVNDIDGQRVRLFGPSAQLGYCEKVPISPDGKGTSTQHKLAYCANDAMSAEDRATWCDDHPLSDATFAALYISNPQPQDMCNQHACLYVPGHRSAPTLKTFIANSGIDFTNKRILVAPFNVKSIGFGFYNSLVYTEDSLDGAKPVDTNIIRRMGIMHKKLFQYATHLRESVTANDIMDAATEFMDDLCWKGRCRRIAQPDYVDNNVDVRSKVREQSARHKYTEDSDTVLPPIHDTEIVLRFANMSVESAVVAYPLKFGNPSHRAHNQLTRFVVRAPEIFIGEMFADQTGCASGYKCAAVLIAGPNASFTNVAMFPGSRGVRTLGTAIPVMALGRTHHHMGIVNLDHSIVKIDNDKTDIVMEHVIAVAAASGTIHVTCTSKQQHSCSAVAQYEPPPTKLVIAADLLLLPTYNMSAAIGMFGVAEIKRLSTRPIDHGAITFVGFVILVVIAVLALLFHAGLFVKSTQIAVWIVQKRAIIEQCSGDRWECVFSPSKNQHVIRFSSNARETSASLVIARVICGVDGGCAQYNDYPDLIRYSWDCFTK